MHDHTAHSDPAGLAHLHDRAHHHDHSHESVAAPRWAHGAALLGEDHRRNEGRSWAVIALTVVTMVAEIAAGMIFGSMALQADGWHMATHAGALLIAALSYGYARRHAEDPQFSFGTGKVGELAGFSSAVLLGLVALLIGWESLMRLVSPVSIHFSEAMIVAVVGLGVNLVSAALLHQGGGNDHSHDHHPHHGHVHFHPAGGDSNLRAAYLHVLADALTSVLAIVALLAGRLWGWVWLDPVIGVLGALMIARWALVLARQSGSVLVDRLPEARPMEAQIRAALETDGARIEDLHLWHLGPAKYGAIVAIEAIRPLSPDSCRTRLAHLPSIVHLTVEVAVRP